MNAPFAVAAAGLLIAGCLAHAPAAAAKVDVRLYGTATSGGTITGQSFAGQSVVVGFSYDTAAAGVAGVFSGGVNFLNPFVTLNGAPYVVFTDELPPVHPTTITVVNGAPDSLAVDFDIDGYVGITNRTEALTINFAGAADFISSITALPTAVNVLGNGTGSFSLLYADDCQNYACGPTGIFYSNAVFSINRLEISASPVPEAASYGLFGIGLLGVAWATRRRGG